MPPTEKNALLAAKEARQPPHTRLETLRTLLDDLQVRVIRLQEQPAEETLAILLMMDKAAKMLAALRETGSPVSSEATLFETIQGQLRKNRGLFLARMGGAAALTEFRARRQPPPPAENWWWFVDQSLAKERRRLLRNLSLAATALLAIAIALGLAYQRLLAPDPALQAAVGWQTRAESALLAGEYPTALEAATQAIALRPNQPDVYLLQGVIYEMLEQPAAAAQSFAAAWDLYPAESKSVFYTQRAGYYLMAAQLEQTRSDARAALKLNPDSAMAYLRLAQVHELLGERQQAIAAYQQAAETAKRTDDPQIEVIAKMGLAQLLQSPER